MVFALIYLIFPLFYAISVTHKKENLKNKDLKVLYVLSAWYLLSSHQPSVFEEML